MYPYLLSTGIAAFVLLGSFLMSMPVFRSSIPSTITHPTIASAATAFDSATPASIKSSLESAGLPISSVQVRPAPNAVGTVIYIPQLHRNPGSAPADPANDTAVAAQTQIRDITKYLTQNGARYAMVEGDMFGPVASSSLNIIAQKMQARDALAKAALSISQSCQGAQACARAVQGAQTDIAQLDREITLAGGAHDVKAAGGTFSLYGAEDQATQEKSGSIVRDYFYLSDRLATLTGQQPSSNVLPSPANPSTTAGPMIPANAQGAQGANPLAAMMGSQAGGGTISQILQMLMQMQQGQKQATLSDNAIQNLAQYATQTGNANLRSGASALTQALALARSAEHASQAADAKAAAGLPSRAQNPYSSDTSVSNLQSKISTVQNEIQNTIVDERNTITSQNFVKGLSATGAHAGILIYGAGHTSGLINDLNAEGLNVIVVVPQQLGGDPELQQALTS